MFKCLENLNSFKNFYKEFLNKIEKIKDWIDNIFKKGKFNYKISEIECFMEILCMDGIKYIVLDLNDLRSRVFFI